VAELRFSYYLGCLKVVLIMLLLSLDASSSSVSSLVSLSCFAASQPVIALFLLVRNCCKLGFTKGSSRVNKKVLRLVVNLS